MATRTQTQPASIIYRWPRQGEWTYEDYARLPDDGRRYEVIDGRLHVSPAPRTKHQLVSFELAFALYTYIKANNLGRVLEAPIDLILPGLTSPVQPDILFIAQERLPIIQEKFIEGVPDLIIEVLSPGNQAHDRHLKYALYEEAGVKEYWIVDPDNCLVDVYTLYDDNQYMPFGHFERGGVIQSSLLPNLRLPLDEICEL
jgi:Uma2 family endonuclease